MSIVQLRGYQSRRVFCFDTIKLLKSYHLLQVGHRKIDYDSKSSRYFGTALTGHVNAMQKQLQKKSKKSTE